MNNLFYKESAALYNAIPSLVEVNMNLNDF